MNQVRVIGWYDHGNVGDEAYKLAFSKLFPEFEFSFDAKNCETAILGGGDILNKVFVNELLKYPSKKKIAMSISANSNTPFELLSQLDAIYVRDKKSFDLLNKKNISCTYMPDIATCLEPQPELGLKWLKNKYSQEGLDLYEKKVGVVLNAHLSHGSPDILARDFINLIKVIWDLARMMDETNASFILFPMSTHLPYDDRVTNGMINSRCKYWKKNLVIYDKLNVQETLNLISSFDAVISTRLHASIFSTISNVPFIDLVHHDKNKSFLQTFGLEDYSTSYWHFEYEKVYNQLKNILEDGESSRKRLEQILSEQLQILKRVSANVSLI